MSRDLIGTRITIKGRASERTPMHQLLSSTPLCSRREWLAFAGGVAVAALTPPLQSIAQEGPPSGVQIPKPVQGRGPFHVLATEADRAVREFMEAHNIPGATLCIMVNGQIVANRAYGFRDRELKEPMQIDSLLRVASVEKLFISTAINSLIVRGLRLPKSGITLTLETPFFPLLEKEWGLTPPPVRQSAPNVSDITIDHLLAHKSGIPFFPSDQQVMDEFKMTEGSPTRGQIVRWVFAQPLASKPGAEFRYNNLGYDMLRWLVEWATPAALGNRSSTSATGKTSASKRTSMASTKGGYIDFFRRNILAPAGGRADHFLQSAGDPSLRDRRESWYFGEPLDETSQKFIDRLILPAVTCEALARYLSYWAVIGHGLGVPYFDVRTGQVLPEFGGGAHFMDGAAVGTSAKGMQMRGTRTAVGVILNSLPDPSVKLDVGEMIIERFLKPNKL